MTSPKTLHPVHTPSKLAALRGEPSYVWRAGQERRLAMIAQWTRLEDALILEHGCGEGMYTSQIRHRYSPHVEAFDIEFARVALAQHDTPHALVAAAEALPYASSRFDTVFSNEVIEHVQDDTAAVREMVRVLKPGGRVLIFCPNRWYPVEQHGHYWRGQYHFGNTPLVNYLPDVFRNRLAPHVRTYTRRGLLRLFADLPVTQVHYRRIYGGYDNFIRKFGRLGKLIRGTLHGLEGTPLDVFGLSHLLVMEKTTEVAKTT